MSSRLLPEPIPRTSARKSSSALTSLNKWTKFVTRLFRFNQMDFEFATWQMIYLFISPQKVFKNSSFRKHTKNQYARDDPAFLVLLAGWFILSAAALSIVLQLHFIGFIKFIFWLILVDCIAIGLVVATVFWFVTNKFFKQKSINQLLTQQEDVEWGYAFDVHLNAFFPPLIILHVFQMLFFNYFISQDWFLARLFGNTLWLISSMYYCYITYLGYDSLPYSKNTKFILYGSAPLILIYFITILSGINIMRMIMDFYKYRVY